MLRSMTGFGDGNASRDGEEIAVELRSVNHKFCEVKVRISRELASLEPQVVKTVKDRLARGAVEITVKRRSATATGTVPVVDVGLAREYHRAFSQLRDALGLRDEISLKDLAAMSGVIRMDEPAVDLQAGASAIGHALEQALAKLMEMRKVEGAAIRADLSARLGLVEVGVEEITQWVPAAVEEYRARLADRIAELSKGPVDPQRLVQEVAYFAERTDVAEEMTRLRSHLGQFRALLDSPEPAGRKMDFLVQEMHREINTTGSKSQHPQISTRVVALKAELERIREQVQNVE